MLNAKLSQPNINAVIDVRNINKHFGTNHVLKNITIDIKQGETIVICGSSGSGKSTLLRCLNGLETYESGEITVLGTRVNKRNMRDCAYRVSIGMVFQKYSLFPHMSVMRNLCIAPMKVLKISRKDAEERAESTLEKVGLGDKVKAWPQELSGGQQQRVAIARALMLTPKVLLFDEPTSALDPETIREVLDVMRGLAKDGMTLVVVTHELGFARDVADRIVYMDQGSIQEISTSEEFFTKPKTDRAKEFLNEILNS